MISTEYAIHRFRRDVTLGTMVRFNRAGVTYTVVGSVPAAAADAAARAL